MTRFRAQVKRIFDESKIIVVGSPSISEDGVASGLKANNYIRTPLFNLAELTEIEFDYDITTKEQTGSVYLCGLKDTALSLYIAKTGYMQLLFTNNYSTATIPPSAYNVGKLHFRFVINPISLKAFVYVFQNGNKIGEIDIAISSSILTTKSFIFGADYSGNYGYALNGSIDLKSIKVAQEGTVYSPTKPVYALERRKPKVWNKGQFTIVGNPSIASDGFISNCSGSNYAKINSPITSVNNKFQVDCTIPIGTGVPFVIYIGTSARMFFWRNANNKLLVVLRSTTTDVFNNTVEVPETSLNVKCIVENNTCLVNVNGETLINKTITASAFFEMLNNSDYFTFGSDIGNNPFNQPLDLKTFKIYTDNNLVFDGGAETYVYDPSKFTVVGTPTITEYGVASGFSGTNYITTSKPISSNNNIFKFKFKYNGVKPESGNFYYLVLTSGEGELFYVYQNANNALSIYSSKTGATSIFTGPMITLSANHIGTTFDIEVVTTSEKYTCNVYRDSVLLGSQSIATTNLLPSNISKVNLGGQQNSSTINSNSINLPSISITVDGKEVFTGAKEQYYAMRGM